MQRSISPKNDLANAKYVVEYLRRSFELTRAGRLEEAVEEIQKQIAMHPESSVLNFRLGIILYDLGKYELACKSFKKELEITPNFRDAAWEMGSAYSRLRLADKSIEAYEKALEIDSCCAEAYYGIGNAHLARENYKEAIEYYHDALFLRVDLDQSSLFSTGKDYKNLEIAIYFNLGIVYMVTKDVENAQDNFRKVGELDQASPVAKQAALYLDLLSDPENLNLLNIKSVEFPGDWLTDEYRNS